MSTRSDEGKASASHRKDGVGASPPPSLSAFINLSDYMYYAYNTPYGPTGLQTDIQFSPLMSNGNIVSSVINKDGFYAEAFGTNLSKNGTVTKNSQVIIAYEGTNLLAQGGTFRGGQAIDNAYIYAGGEPPSAADSIAFAQRVINQVAPTIGKSNVFLTGHSLGAADAEYAAQATQLAGVTFAAPGIATLAKQKPSNLTNYVDYNDPIGNYANDGPGNQPGQNPYGALLTSQNIAHYGSPTIIDTSIFDSAVTDFVTDLNNGDYDSAGTRFLQGLSYHPLTNYASSSDLNLTLYLSDGSKGADAGFFASALVGAASSPAASVDASWVAAGMTGTGGVSGASTHAAGSSTGSPLTADAQAAHALGHGSRRHA